MDGEKIHGGGLEYGISDEGFFVLEIRDEYGIPHAEIGLKLNDAMALAFDIVDKIEKWQEQEQH